MIDQEKLTLELGLLCWHEFYQKCHELENNILVKDDIISKYIDDNSTKYPGGITERELTWRDADFSYIYKNKILPKFDNYFEEKYHFDQLYDEYVLKIESQNEYYKNKIKKLESKELGIYTKKIKKLEVLFKILCTLLYLFVLIILLILYYNTEVWVFSILFIILALCVFNVWGLFEVHFYIIIDKRNKRLRKKIDKFNGCINFPMKKKTWIKTCIDIKNYPQFSNDLEIIKKEYDDWIKTQKLKIETEVNNLKALKNKLGKIFPLPYKYSGEYVVTALLSLLLDGRANTLEAAINLLETEKSRDKNLTNLNLLDRNLKELKKLVLSYKEELINSKQNNVELYNIYDEINNYKFKEKYFDPDNFNFDFNKQEDEKEFSKN